LEDIVASRNNIMKRGKSWYVRITVNGRDIWRSAGKSKQAAQELLPRLRAEAEREALGLPKKPLTSPTLDKFMPKYLKWAKAHKRSYKRDEWCSKQLVEAFGQFRLAEITKPRVQAFMRDRQEEVSAATVNRQVALLRKVLSYAVEQGKLDANPLQGIKLFPEPPPRQPTLEQKEEQKLIRAGPAWFGFMVRLAIATGCRQGELLALRWRHVDFDNAALVVEDSKSGESRRVPLHPVMLAELRSRRGLPDGYVVMMKSGEVPTTSGVVQAMRRAANKIGRRDLRFHDLRHIAGSRLLAAGASLPEVATFLGHKTLSIARRYAHTSWTRLHDLVGQMPVANGESEKADE